MKVGLPDTTERKKIEIESINWLWQIPHLLCLTTCPTLNWTWGGRASLGSGLCKCEVQNQQFPGLIKKRLQPNYNCCQVGFWPKTACWPSLTVNLIWFSPVRNSHLCPWTWKPQRLDIHPGGPSSQEGPTEHKHLNLGKCWCTDKMFRILEF